MPGKVLALVCGANLLHWHVTRLLKVAALDEVVVACPDTQDNDRIATYCERRHWRCWRGPEEDVLGRYYGAAKAYQADVVVRTTADCPLIDPGVVAGAIKLYHTGEFDYVSNNLERTFPHGLDVEVFSMEALAAAWRTATEPTDREHVSEWIRRHQDRPYRLGNLRFPLENVAPHFPSCPIGCDGIPLPTLMKEARITVDYPEDYLAITMICQFWARETRFITTEDVMFILHRTPKLVAINRQRAIDHAQHLGGLYEPISEEQRAALSQANKDAIRGS